MLNEFPYLGKGGNKPHDERLGDWVVEKLKKLYINKDRNVTR